MRLASVTVLLALTTSASAGPPGVTPPVPTAPEPLPIDDTPSYRLQVLGLDAAVIGLVLVADASSTNGHGNTSLQEIALATYLVGPPLVHLLHDRPGRAAASLALRVGAPVVLGVIGWLVTGGANTSCISDFCDQPGLAGLVVGGLIGFIAAPVIDAAVLAAGDPRPSSTHVMVTARRDGGMTFGLAGAF